MDNLTGFINYEDLEYGERRELVDRLILNYKTRTNCNFNNLEEHLYDIWRDVIEDFQIDHEYRYVCRNEEFVAQTQEPWEDEIEEIRRAYINSAGWIIIARKKYEEKINILYSEILSQNGYPKHYPNPKWSTKEMIKRSYTDSILEKNMTLDIQDKIFCELVNIFWAELVSNRILTFVAQTKTTIGYSKGKECNNLVFKIDPINNQVHCYPINNSELKENIKTYSINPNDIFKNISPYENDEIEERQNIFLTNVI